MGLGEDMVTRAVVIVDALGDVDVEEDVDTEGGVAAVDAEEVVVVVSDLG